MATRSFQPKDDSLLSDYQPMPERAPSQVVEEPFGWTQALSFIGFFLLAVGVLAVLAVMVGWRYPVSAGIGFFLATTGLGLILFHTYTTRDTQYLRVYTGLAFLCLFGALALAFTPYKQIAGFFFLPFGIPLIFAAFLLLVGVLRNEADGFWHSLLTNTLGLVGAGLILLALIFGNLQPTFVPVEGLLFLVLGLLYVAGYLGFQNPRTGWPDTVAGLLTIVGILLIAVGILRSALEVRYLIPLGLVWIGMGAIYTLIGVGLRSDWPVVVLTRRELASYFYSPIAYLVMICMLIFAGISFWLFTGRLQLAMMQGGGLAEPILFFFIFDLPPVVALTLFVPVLTMRLLSEEWRTGSLEVLLTAPVSETSIVLGKFLAAWIFFLITWLPYLLFPIGLRLFGREEFDYWPLLSFFIALMASGAGFVAMGLFFSSLTSNQIIAAVLTCVGMMVHLSFHLAKWSLGVRAGNLNDFLSYISYLDLWGESLQGNLVPRYLVFHLTAAAFFLVSTGMVLNSRKWK